MLPSCWTVEDGFLQLGQVQDEWILEGNYLTKRHYGARDCEFTPTAENCPIDMKYLTKQRITKLANGQVTRDKWTRSTPCTRLQGYDWTGYTRFKIHTSWRRQAHKDFYDKSQNTETIYMQHEQLNERSMSLADRLAFLQAKEKELKFVFENDVWDLDTMTEDKRPRTIRAKFILNWQTDNNGGRRAKPRLISQGFKDPGALNGSLTTASPTLTRLSRSLVLSITSMLGYTPFTADITTAFLQGKKYDPNSDRVLWIKLPKEAEQILGLQGDHVQVMRLTKPMYGLVDATKAWFDEAVTRILETGKGAIIQHTLDSDRPIQLCAEDQQEPKLLAIFGIHVDRTSSSSARGTQGPRRRSSRTVEPKSPKLQMAIQGYCSK